MRRVLMLTPQSGNAEQLGELPAQAERQQDGKHDQKEGQVYQVKPQKHQQTHGKPRRGSQLFFGQVLKLKSKGQALKSDP